MAAGAIKQGYIKNAFEEGMIAKLGRLTRKDIKNAPLYGSGYKKVYICSPYAGNIKENVAAAKEFCRFAIKRECQPVASHLLYPQVLNDEDPLAREMGLSFGLSLLSGCEEVWVFKDYKGISDGMQREISCALKLKIPVVFIPKETVEGTGWDPIRSYDKSEGGGS